MKTLLLPTQSSDSITITEISPEFNGVIIGYKDIAAIGYITYHEGYYCFSNTLNDWDEIITEEEGLFVLIKEIIQRGLCDNFKVIDFIV